MKLLLACCALALLAAAASVSAGSHDFLVGVEADSEVIRVEVAAFKARSSVGAPMDCLLPTNCNACCEAAHPNCVPQKIGTSPECAALYQCKMGCDWKQPAAAPVAPVAAPVAAPCFEGACCFARCKAQFSGNPAELQNCMLGCEWKQPVVPVAPVAPVAPKTPAAQCVAGPACESCCHTAHPECKDGANCHDFYFCMMACDWKQPAAAPVAPVAAPVAAPCFEGACCFARCKAQFSGNPAELQNCMLGCEWKDQAAPAVVAPVVPESRLSEKVYQSLFSAWVKKHSKKYTHDDFFPRYAIFKANYNKIRAHNAGKATFSMALNEFADMTWTEFSSKMKGYNRKDNALLRSKNGPHKHVKTAGSIDWRAKGAVTPVKNQQQCGSCWSFSTTGSVEGAHFIATGELVSLSEQQLIDCSVAQGNNGCNGGLPDQAFQYVITNGGITTEAAYPYTAAQGTCRTNLTVAATISSFTDVTSGDENALMQAVNIGPVSVGIEADQQCFQFYSGGVLSNTACGTNLDHAVLVVGYGTDASTSQDYWIVKNSWGATWGESGYIRLIRGSNECGVSSAPSYPVV